MTKNTLNTVAIFLAIGFSCNCSGSKRSVERHERIVQKNAAKFSTLLSKFSELADHELHSITNFGHKDDHRWTSTGLIGKSIQAKLIFPVEINFRTEVVRKTGPAQLRLYNVEKSELLKNEMHQLNYSSNQPILDESDFYKATIPSIKSQFTEHDIPKSHILNSFSGFKIQNLEE